jgi:hypothetical protein
MAHEAMAVVVRSAVFITENVLRMVSPVSAAVRRRSDQARFDDCSSKFSLPERLCSPPAEERAWAFLRWRSG